MGSLRFQHAGGDVVAGRYQVVMPIGIGGSAAVYAATDAESGEHVALKVMHESDGRTVGRQRFEREAAFVQQLHHPHIVDVLDFGYTKEDQPYIVFSLLKGRSLKTAIKRGGAMEEERAATLILQVLDALIAAHAKGIVHRDIKPANIYLQAVTHDVERAQVLDFGLAKMLFGDEEELLETLTQTGHRLGTPRYMAPEMARSEKMGPAGDLYAVGLVFAEMLGGKPVVQSNVQVEVLAAHASRDPLPLDPAVRAGPFGAVIERAIQKDAAKRHPDAAAMYRDITLALQRPGPDDEPPEGSSGIEIEDEGTVVMDESGGDDEPEPPTQRMAGANDKPWWRWWR